LKKRTGVKSAVKTFEVDFVSDPKKIVLVEPFLLKVNTVARLDDGTFYRLLVAATEAVNNAIMHGNKSNPRKRVWLTCRYVKNDSLTLSVRDEGEGFNPDIIPNPLDEENLLKASGRGVFLMRELMDRVDYKIAEHGSTVEIMIDLKRLG
jgi:serine/threonine-protein kinase RsbW